MRSIGIRTVTTVLLMGAALTITGCGKSTSTNATDNAALTEMNDTGSMEGTTNDAGAMDSATDTNMISDNVATGNIAGDNISEAGNAM